MELKSLQRHIRSLATLPETSAQVVSCYLELEKGGIKDPAVFHEQVHHLTTGLAGQERQDFKAAMAAIQRYLAVELSADAKGAAIFSRAGAAPFFLPLQFRLPLPNWVTLQTTPNIYHLVELKDAYDRYILMFCTEKKVWILEVNLGAVTKELWRERVEIRGRVGRDWTKAQYQRHQKKHNQTLLTEMIYFLDRRISEGGFIHLILAGDPKIMKQVRDQLPKHLIAKLSKMLSAPSGKPTLGVVAESISSFVETEQKKSHAVGAELADQLCTGGLAVAGSAATIEALQRGQVDMLVLAEGYRAEPGLRCETCSLIHAKQDKTTTCSNCGSSDLRDLDMREEMVRLAVQYGATVEVVPDHDVLMRFGGVGCLLRYRWSEAP